MTVRANFWIGVQQKLSTNNHGFSKMLMLETLVIKIQMEVKENSVSDGNIVVRRWVF